MLINVEDLYPRKILNFYFPLPLGNKINVIEDIKTIKDEFLLNIFTEIDVNYCLLSKEGLSIGYNSGVADDIRAFVLAQIDDYITAGTPDIETIAEVSDFKLAQVLADAYIRPILHRDGGDIEICSIDFGVMTLSFKGHCIGCPLAGNTLQNVIKKKFLHFMPDLKDIKLKEE